MSVKIMGLVWELDLPQRDLLVLLALADHADHEGGNAYPSLALIAWKVNVSERTVQRAIAKLVNQGVLEAEGRPGKTTVFSLHLDRCPAKPPFKNIDPRQIVTPVKMPPLTRQAKKVTTTPDTAMSPEPSITNHPTTTTVAVAVEETQRPNVYGMYERQFGMTLTPGIADTLKDIVKDYGEEWTNDALAITATAGRRGNLRYVAAILRNWQRDGRETERLAPVVVDEKTAWRAEQKARPNVLYDAALDMLLPAFKDEDDRRRYITEYLKLPYAPVVEEAAS